MTQTILQRITDKILYMPHDEHTDRPLLAAITGAERTLLVDAGNSSAHADRFLRELDRHNVTAPSLLVLTHWHWDHVFGCKRMNLPTIAHIRTREQLLRQVDFTWTDEALDKRVATGEEISFCAEMIKKEFPTHREIAVIPPAIVFEQRLEIDLGKTTCIIEHVGGDHADDSCIVFAKEEGVLFLGDCLYPDYYSGDWKYTPANVRALLAKLQKYDADHYVISHRAPLTKAEFLHEAAFYLEICSLLDNSVHDVATLHRELTRRLGKELTVYEGEILQCFVNGHTPLPAR